MNRYTVIIPSCTEANLDTCRNSMRITQPDAQVLVYANGPLARVSLRGHWDATSINADANQPFIYSRAINECAGRIPSDRDLILLNDDTCLLTPNGFDLLREAAYAHPECGLMFPSVTGCTGNPEQITQAGGGVRLAKRITVPFICVYIRREIWDRYGPLDEAFRVDYGFEDSAFCTVVRLAGYHLGIFDGCVIEHGVLPSSFRPNGQTKMSGNRAIYEQKYGEMRGKLLKGGLMER